MYALGEERRRVQTSYDDYLIIADNLRAAHARFPTAFDVCRLYRPRWRHRHERARRCTTGARRWSPDCAMVKVSRAREWGQTDG
ncbi:MAG: hypothetical protein U0521_05485 [Anaerolineae bacterium]